MNSHFKNKLELVFAVLLIISAAFVMNFSIMTLVLYMIGDQPESFAKAKFLLEMSGAAAAVFLLAWLFSNNDND